MKKVSLAVSIAMLLVMGIGVSASSANAPDDSDYLLFTSFKGNGDGLHLAISQDGYHWTALNKNNLFLKPTIGTEKLMRDPCIVQAADGVFHMVWTTGWYVRDIGYASSTDLIHWSDQKIIPVMEHEPAARNSWAPELYFDEFKKQWLILWASTIPGRFAETDNTGNNGLNHRIYYTTTKDFKTFSPTKLFFDPGFSSIDATILKVDKRYYLFFKDERQNPLKKNLRLAIADRPDGPYTNVSEPFTKDWVEGPTGMKIKNEWFVYFDEYRNHHYGAVKSTDLQHWQDVSAEMFFPEGQRHGSILKISKTVAESIMKADTGIK